MKKCLSVFLVVLMILSIAALAGCEEAADEPSTAPVSNAPSDTPAEKEPVTEVVTTSTGGEVTVVTAADGTVTYNGVTVSEMQSAKPCDYILEKLAAGLRPIIACSFVSLTSDYMVSMNTGMEEAFVSAGFEYAYATSEETINIQLEHIENYVTMGASIIIINPNDADMVGTASQSAMAAGSYVVVRGTISAEYNITMSCVQDQVALGENVGKMVLAWIDKQYGKDYDGTVKGAVFYNLNIPDFKTRYETFMVLMEADPRVDIVYENAGPVMSTDAAFTASEEAMTFDPETRFFICTTSSGALGVSNYILSQSYTEAELEGFASFGSDSTVTAIEMVDTAIAGGDSILKGFCYTGTTNPADAIVVPVFSLINGEYDIPGAVVAERVSTYNSFGFEI